MRAVSERYLSLLLDQSSDNIIQAIAHGIHEDLTAMGFATELYGRSLLDSPTEASEVVIIHFVSPLRRVIKLCLQRDNLRCYLVGRPARTFAYCDPAFPDNLYDIFK